MVCRIEEIVKTKETILVVAFRDWEGHETWEAKVIEIKEHRKRLGQTRICKDSFKLGG